MIDEVSIIELKESIFEDNNADADKLRKELNEKKTFLINLMSAPGSGKTTFLTQVIRKISDRVKIGVLEADIDGDVDARTILKEGASCVQVHTGGMCHLDADMTRQSINGLGAQVDMAFLENIGNLVCPAEYDTGSHLNIMILSVPEGDDKPAKYPLMFSSVSAVLVNKIDTIEYFDFDMVRCEERVHALNPEAKLFPISAATGDGMEAFLEWLMEQYEAWKEKNGEEK